MNIGDQLANGATLLAWKEERDSVIVLALSQKNEFVTWELCPQTSVGATHSGHYHATLLSAVEDFKTRT